MLSTACLIAVFVACNAAGRLSGSPRSEPERRIADLIQRLRGAPAEIGAHGILVLIEAGKVSAPKERRSLVEDAYHMAARAQDTVAQIALPVGRVADRSHRAASAKATGLNRLSLQSRAVTAMLSYDSARAQELFASIELPEPKRLTCEDALLDSQVDYYATLGRLLEKGFSKKERAEGKHLQVALLELKKITSPLQLRPMLKVLRSSPWTGEEMQPLIAGVSGTLVSIRVDDRTFSYTSNSLFGMIQELESFGLAGKQAGASPDSLVSAIRDYLAFHLSSERCADSMEPPKPLTEEEKKRQLPEPAHPLFSDPSQPPIVSYFNDKLRLSAYLPSSDLPALVPEQVKPRKVMDGKITADRPYTAAEEEILKSVQLLRWGTGPGLVDKSTNEWLRAAGELLQKFRQLRAESDEPATQAFQVKSQLYTGFYQAVPPSRFRDEILADLTRYLGSVQKAQVGISAWYREVRYLLEAGRKQDNLADPILSALAQTGDPDLWVVVELMRVAPGAG